jgi:predicted DNA-binding transcriptional regulator AlpA
MGEMTPSAPKAVLSTSEDAGKASKVAPSVSATAIPASVVGVPESVLDPPGLAAFLGVPLKTIYQWNSEGTGPRRSRIGRHVRYRMADVVAWLGENAVERR